jgi:hypothetical protein
LLGDAGVTMVRDGSKVSDATGCLSQIGLAAIIGFGTMSVLAWTVLVPPWVRVTCQRQELLYSSREVKVYEATFVGYDWLLADEKWRRIAPPAVASGQLFDATEYRICWPVLIVEWVVVGAAAGCLFVVLSRRLRAAPKPIEANAERVAAADPPRGGR